MLWGGQDKCFCWPVIWETERVRVAPNIDGNDNVVVNYGKWTEKRITLSICPCLSQSKCSVLTNDLTGLTEFLSLE